MAIFCCGEPACRQAGAKIKQHNGRVLRRTCPEGEHVMADKFRFSSAGEIQDVEFAFARNNWTHAQVKQAAGGDFLAQVREVLEGRAEICRVKRLTSEAVPAINLIDCDADPAVLNGLMIHSHTKGGKLAFDPSKVTLHLSEKQQSGGVIQGNKLLKELVKKSPLNACVLDYLLKNTHLISESWKGKTVFFFGTVYRGASGNLYVRCLKWGGERWYSDYSWLGIGWSSNDPVALPTS